MRLSTRLLACSLVPFLLFVLRPAHPQSIQLGKIIANVHVTHGDFPVHPVLVTLEMRGSPVNSTYSDENGRVGFYNLVASEYRVIVNDDAYEPFSQTVNLDPTISVQYFVNIMLTVRPNTKKDPLPRIEGSNPFLIDPAEYYSHFPKKTLKEFDKGRNADQKGNADEAIQHYQKALGYSPDFYPAHNNLGAVYLSKQNFTEAQTQFEAALQANQNDGQAYFNLANVLLLTQQYPAAELEIADGLQRRPDSAFGHFLQGRLYSLTGKPDQAEQNLQSALRLDPKMSQAHLQLVNLYLQEKRIPEAINELETYLKAFPESAFTPKARDLLKRLQTGSSASPQ